MRRNKLALYLHLIWATWDRLPLIKPEIERRLLRNIESEAQGLGCKVLAINCIDDHVHVLLAIPTTVSIADLVKQLKGVSSHFANDELELDYQFKWQGSYGAFTVSRWDVDKVKQYVKRQKEHHAAGELMLEFEETFEELETDDHNLAPSAQADDRL
jgi:putative transposase